jgi:hypothetical protein
MGVVISYGETPSSKDVAGVPIGTEDELPDGLLVAAVDTERRGA